jgi:hypothetical protein
MSQEELEAILTQYAPVERVWLQKHRSEKHQKQHRGFGYVVFRDANAVEDLLGDKFSRFVDVGHGVRLEMKRALSSKEIQSGLPWSPEPSQLEDAPPPPSPEVVDRAMPWGGDQVRVYQQTPHVIVTQAVPTYPVTTREEYLMRTPPPARSTMFAPDNDLGTPQTMFFSPFPVAAQPLQERVQQQQQLPAAMPDQPLQGAIMAMLLSPPPGGGEALEQMLRDAAPDHYED